MKYLLTIVLLLIGCSSSANERAESARLAPKYGAKTEVRLEDGTICDLVSDTYAIEVEYPRKWAESVGQAVHYGDMLNKKSAIILLLSDPAKEWQFLVRCARLCGKLGITLYIEPIANGPTIEDVNNATISGIDSQYPILQIELRNSSDLASVLYPEDSSAIKRDISKFTMPTKPVYTKPSEDCGPSSPS